MWIHEKSIKRLEPTFESQALAVILPSKSPFSFICCTTANTHTHSPSLDVSRSFSQVSSDGESGGNNDLGPGLGGDIAVAVFPPNLNDFTDDLLAQIFRSLAVQHDTMTLEHDSLALFVGVTLVNRRARSLIRNRLHAEYRAALHALACFVPGTRIPCGALRVLPVPSPANWDETWDIFNDTMVLAPNGLEVGGIFNYHSMYWTESLEMDVEEDEQREFLLLVQTYWFEEDIYVPALVSGEGICDVRALPNNLRSSMGHLESSVSYDSVRRNNIGYYYRFVRVRGDTSMQEVFDAITFVEGWNLPTYNMCLADEDIDPDVDVLGTMAMETDEQWRLAINWPSLSIRVVCENNTDNGEDPVDNVEDPADDGEDPADDGMSFLVGEDDALSP